MTRQFSAVLLTGACQTGKTSLLRRLYPEASFVSLDLPSAAQQAKEAPEDFLGQRMQAIILDEVQYAPRIFRYLKKAINEHRQNMGRFLMTESQNGPKQLSFSPPQLTMKHIEEGPAGWLNQRYHNA